MNLLEFTKRFPTEQSCKDHLKKVREYEGFTCSKCLGKNHYWLSTVELWKCKDCGSRTNLKAGTLMERSKIPMLTWFTVLHLMTSTKKAFSALEMQRQVGSKRYEPIWYCMQKIRVAMGKRDAQYQLKGDIELDNAFYTTVKAGGKPQGRKIRASHDLLRIFSNSLRILT